MALASAAMAQDDAALEGEDVEAVPTPSAEDFVDSAADEVLVTGSRLRKNEFTSPSPLSVLEVDDARDIGVTSVQELLSRAVVANGAQIDQSRDTSPGGVGGSIGSLPPGGAGSSNVSLRGLGPERTLVLVNGRRLAATGVRGAPSQPDINLIPFSMVERLEISTDAGSSVYGADAVAGTVNVILRTDFEGVEFSGNFAEPEADGGRQYQIGAIAGAQGDRARVTFAAEYFDRQRVLIGDRDYSAPSTRFIRVNEAGDVVDPFGIGGLPTGASDNFGFVLGTPTNATSSFDLFPGFALFRFTEGTSDAGIQNFSTFTSAVNPTPSILSNPAYNDSEERRQADLVGDLERLSLVANGEVDFELFGSESQFYFEGLYLNRQNTSIQASPNVIFPQIPADIPLVDATTGLQVIEAGAPVFVDNPFNPFDGAGYEPILTIEDLQQRFNVELEQIRIVAGFRGDIDVGWFGDNDWTYDTYFSYDRGTGFVAEPTIFEPHFIQSIRGVAQLTDGRVTCGIPGFDQVPELQFDGSLSPVQCVPFNAASPTLYSGGEFGEGTFSSQEERDYLIAQRNNRTAIEQYVGFGFLQGRLAQSPWGGDIQVGLGYEFRRDIIDSFGDFTGTQGVGLGASIEGLTQGARNFNEVFAEIDIPLITGRPGIELLNIDGALRYTDETNFGDDLTFRSRVQYKPVEWFSLSGGYGTSFRAPNLRESFLAQQVGGIGGAIDPCTDDNLAGALIAAGGDDSDPVFVNLISNCAADGVAITDSDGNGLGDTTPLGEFGDIGVGLISGGSGDLDPETSRTFTITAILEQPWYDAFQFSIAGSYYDIKINNTVRELDPVFLVNDCYLNPDFPGLTSPFCGRITRTQGTAGGRNDGIETIDSSFVNVGEITARGFDITTAFGADLPFLAPAGIPMFFSMATTVAYQLEQEEQVFPTAPRDDNAGEIGSPKFRLNNTAVLFWSDFRLSLNSRRIGAQQQDPTLISGFAPFSEDVTGQLSRPVDFVDPVWYHDVALTFERDEVTFTVGVNNVADRDPPLVDFGVGAPQNVNVVTGTGYDLFGRSFFANARIAF
ncbi:MAG: TonB-dependent receptor [Pseudomonadota bacterium]